jgi:plastin-1
MILILTASIMYWSLQQPAEESESESNPAEDCKTPDASSPAASVDGERETALASEVSNMAINDDASDSALSPKVENEESSDKVEGKESPDRE